MAKSQGFIPIYDELRKKILGVYRLPYSHTFTGEETGNFNIDYPSPDSSANLVPIKKITPTQMNIGRKQNDWYMAAVFSYEQIRLEAYKGYKNFHPVQDCLPGLEWVCCHSHPNQAREFDGVILRGLSEDFGSGAPNDAD
jgi:hypothetical protein